MRILSSIVVAALVALASPAGAAEAAKKKGKAKVPVKQPVKAAEKHVLAVNSNQLDQKTLAKIQDDKRLNRKERKEVAKAEFNTYKELRKGGTDEISNTEDAIALRNYRLRNKKTRGLVRKREVSLASVLFPGVSPEVYSPGEPIWINTGLVESRKTQVPYEYYHLPGCQAPKDTPGRRNLRNRRNLGSRLQGVEVKPAPFTLNTKVDVPCTVLCAVNVKDKSLKFLSKLIERQYRVQLTLDTLPVLMRSQNYNYAIRGYPLGFKSPQGSKDIFLYNHLKFAVTYNEDADGVYVTGFDVHPVSIKHDVPAGQSVEKATQLSTCSGMGVENDSSRYLSLEDNSSGVQIVYSYDVQWIKNENLEWSDRWDVYLVGAPDDGIHYYSIVNSLMIILFMTGAIATIMVRTLRKDIAGYNEMQTLEDAQEETGWKLVHGDVFRPPQTSPMALSVAVGTGAQIGSSFVFAMLCAIFKLTNSMRKGQVLTSIILLYVLCGSIAGYVSARLYKFSEAKAWKTNAILTATALPGAFVAIFTVLNVFLSLAGAATAVSFLTIIVLFLLWVCVSAPLVFLGAFVGLKAKTIEVPTKTNQIARIVPDAPWHMNPILTIIMGGILPFGSVCIELAFIMSALWLHQIYYVMGFLLAVIGILGATCAQVSIVLCYLQLCAEDHIWWWRSFWNCASSGLYLYLYSLWFLSSRLDLVGLLPVVIYLTYMGMISIAFGLFCGSVGFLSSLWFTRTIYNAVKVD
mmetsp:Transcript_9162/g.26178  ORF Transcript_9162/g.26178 Transcript_9162/m.26178 type:complete len:744 (+) Transcript_9162:301-2532(+)|eukprot:CAMPEP_0119557264 /NCGR_PEP_ID=MMETSP1352-20130426/8976_1 /TAXON_ID=265584 /ORGANISM="Stauroneis constricta, Strain CCMP1120" /LENGTH=743 /DNA_ID=CAMNT_0007604345 /DNA_START=288 /DNA_END=2519 /DNA_ORIENTATION=+